MSEEILLNIMFTGKYLEDENANIGHEIINLLKDDKGRNYIYVLPYGAMAKKHNNRIKTILLIRRCSSKMFEILAKATNLQQIAYLRTNLNLKEEKFQHNEQIKYIDEQNITYGALKPYKIFEKNNGNDESMYITFRTNSLLKVVRPIYITTDKSVKDASHYFMKDIKHFPSQSPKMYIEEGSKSFDILQGIIDNDLNWEKENTTPTIQEISGKISIIGKNPCNFIDIIKKEDDELVFSNLFKYIFDANPIAFGKFAKDVLGIKKYDETFTIYREKSNIDLLLISEHNAIVIENKIKSNINGICDRHNIGSKLVQSQLKKYYTYVKKEYPNQIKYFFIFAPDYNHIKLENYKCGEDYRLIEFSKVADFFERNKSLYKKVAYFDEFLYSLQKHTKSVDNSHEEIMYKRFVNTINSATTKILQSN